MRPSRPDWNYVQVIKHRSGCRLTGITIKVIYGDPKKVLDLMGGHTAYIERTNLISRQMHAEVAAQALPLPGMPEPIRRRVRVLPTPAPVDAAVGAAVATL
jgi:hypothetical protein